MPQPSVAEYSVSPHRLIQEAPRHFPVNIEANQASPPQPCDATVLDLSGEVEANWAGIITS